MLRAIASYRNAFAGRPSPCRFFPTCSEYGYEAISVHGARRGLWLTVRRLSRCRPFGPSGFDPVPEVADKSRSLSGVALSTNHRSGAVPSVTPRSMEQCVMEKTA